MFMRKMFKRNQVQYAALATIEQLDQRRLLTICSYVSGLYTIKGDDSVNNAITVDWDGGNSELFVKEGATEVCREARSITNIEVYGGNSTSPSATSTGADTITINSSNNIPVSVFGQDGADTITGADEVDYIEGGADADSVRGGDDSDTLFGGSGADFLDGQDGNDSILGEAGNDTCFGGNNDDQIIGGDNNDWLGAGSTPYTNQESGQDFLEGGANNDTVRGGHGPDDMWGDSSSDGTVVGADDIYGGTGSTDDNDDDIVRYGNRTSNLTITMDGVAANDGASGESDNVHADIEILFSGSGNDSIYGNDTANSLNGGSGNDTLRGLGGADTLHGGSSGEDWMDYRESDLNASGNRQAGWCGQRWRG